MADVAPRDQNSVTALLATSSSDGTTVTIYADPVTHRLLVSTGGAATSLLPATGTVNSVNTAFTFTQKPTFIVSDGAWYRENKGWTWNGGTLTATMTIPPNDDIYGFN